MLTFREFLIESANANEIFQSVINYFGTTNKLRRAFWILPNGTMLDATKKGKKAEDSKASFNRFQAMKSRNFFNHDEIKIGFPPSLQNTSDPETLFKDLGAIRHSGVYQAIEMNTKPTTEQKNILYKIVSKTGIQVEIRSKRFGLFNNNYSKDQARAAVRDIDRFYDTGEKSRQSLFSVYR